MLETILTVALIGLVLTGIVFFGLMAVSVLQDLRR